MNEELEAAVSRAYDRAAEVDRRYDEDGIKTLLCALANEPEVLAYLAESKNPGYDVSKDDAKTLLQSLAEIVR
jgi:hypothetical protein